MKEITEQHIIVMMKEYIRLRGGSIEDIVEFESDYFWITNMINSYEEMYDSSDNIECNFSNIQVLMKVYYSIAMEFEEESQESERFLKIATDNACLLSNGMSIADKMKIVGDTLEFLYSDKDVIFLKNELTEDILYATDIFESELSEIFEVTIDDVKLVKKHLIQNCDLHKVLEQGGIESLLKIYNGYFKIYKQGKIKELKNLERIWNYGSSEKTNISILEVLTQKELEEELNKLTDKENIDIYDSVIFHLKEKDINLSNIEDITAKKKIIDIISLDFPVINIRFTNDLEFDQIKSLLLKYNLEYMQSGRNIEYLNRVYVDRMFNIQKELKTKKKAK